MKFPFLISTLYIEKMGKVKKNEILKFTIEDDMIEKSILGKDENIRDERQIIEITKSRAGAACSPFGGRISFDYEFSGHGGVIDSAK